VDFKAALISIGQKLLAYIEIARVSVIFMGLPFAMAGAAYALAFSNLHPIPIVQAIAGMIAVFLVTGAVHTIDDYFDRQRDRQLWPDRQIPSRGINPKTALLISFVNCAIGFVITIIFLNIYCFIVLIIATAWATAYTGFLREKYGYLTLPFAIGLFPIGGYVAFAPATIWSNPIPWILYLMVFLWQSTHILAYSPPHGVENGKTTVPIFFKRFSPKATLIFAGFFAGSCMLVGVFVFFLTGLSYLYLGITVSIGIVLVCLSIYFSKHLTVKNCMFLVFLNSMYGWVVFLEIALEFLYRYDILFFNLALVMGILMMVLTPVLGGFGMPTTIFKEKKGR